MATPRSLSSAERLYQLLLWLYPTKFRRVYGREMALTFRNCYCEVQTYGERWGKARLWSLVLADLVTTAWIEHWRTILHFCKTLMGLEKEFLMTNTFLNLDVALQTDIGQRPTNEDNMISYIPEDQQVMAKKGAIFVVADGLGGHTMGALASEIAVNAVRERYYQDSNEDIATSLQQALEHANLLIYTKNEEIQRDIADSEKKQPGMGTTCVAAVLKDDRIYVANAGDSLVYVIRGKQIKQIAQNHGLLAEQLRNGEITEEEVKAKVHSNVITRCLGDQPTVKVYAAVEPVQDGDRLLLCTDGLWTLISEDELRSIVEQYDPQESVRRLVVRANENGGPDNITAVVVHVSLAA